jgi:hypothetical protein
MLATKDEAVSFAVSLCLSAYNNSRIAEWMFVPSDNGEGHYNLLKGCNFYKNKKGTDNLHNNQQMQQIEYMYK